MSQENSEIPWNSCKCAKCKSPLNDPIQLSVCLHIMCTKCMTEEEKSSVPHVDCVQCGMKNPKSSIPKHNSGIVDTLSPKHCDNDGSHELAMYNCFLCTKNLCRQCRDNHHPDHVDNIQPLESNPEIKVDAENLDATSGVLRSAVNGSLSSSLELQNSTWRECPICESTDCLHINVLQLLRTQPDPADASCKISHHKDCYEKPLPKNYFCCKCWKPVCGDCSQKGEHKDHKIKDMENMKSYLEKTVSDLRQTVSILYAKIAHDLEDQRKIEQGLRKHVDLVSEAMKRRISRELEEIKSFHSKAVSEAEILGKDVMRLYSEENDKTDVLCRFINAFSDALNINVDENLNTLQYVSLLDRLEKANLVMEEIKKEVKQRPRPQEHRLVLYGLNMYNPCPQIGLLVGRECQQPPLSFSFKLNSEISLVYSIVVKGSDQCFLSCSMSKEERDNDAILHYQVVENSNPKETVIEIQPGKYYIARMASGEIVASCSEKNFKALTYFESDELLLERKDSVKLDVIKELNFEPRGIAVTKQNTVLVCAAASQDKFGGSMEPMPGTSMDTCYLMLMSLRGKVLAEAICEKSEELSPNTVAVSDHGEICICDPQKSTLVIMDSNLKFKERIKFSFPPTSDMLSCLLTNSQTDSQILFRPEGVCYDRYGRIIVADSNAHMVVRLARSVDDHEYNMEPLICRADHPDLCQFRFPKLVAIGDDGRLWVVCQEYVFVFDYGVKFMTAVGVAFNEVVYN